MHLKSTSINLLCGYSSAIIKLKSICVDLSGFSQKGKQKAETAALVMSCCPFFLRFLRTKTFISISFHNRKKDLRFWGFTLCLLTYFLLPSCVVDGTATLLEWRAESKQNREMGEKTLIFLFVLGMSCLLTMRWLNPVHGRASKVNCNTICLSWLHSQIPSANSRQEKRETMYANTRWSPEIALID